MTMDMAVLAQVFLILAGEFYSDEVVPYASGSFDI